MAVIDVDKMIADKAAANASANTAEVTKDDKTETTENTAEQESAEERVETENVDSKKDESDNGSDANAGSEEGGESGEESGDAGAEGGNEAEEDEGSSNSQESEPEEVELNEIYLDIDGQERSVAEVITERNELAAKAAAIEGDAFLKGLIEHYQATGNIDAYYEAKGVNWDKKDDVEVLRARFEQENTDLDPKIVEKLWKRELADKYKISPGLSQDEMDSEDYEIAQGLLKRDAKKAREGFKTTQSKFQIPERKTEVKPEQAKFDPQVYKKQLLADKEVDSFMKSKLLKIGVSDETGTSFGFEVENPDSVIEMMSNDQKFWNTMLKDGKVDRAKQAKVYSFSQDPERYEQALVEFGKTLALEERLKEVKNTDGRLNKKTTEQSAVGSSDWKKEFLKAGIQQKKKY
jgi:chorismate mutase